MVLTGIPITTLLGFGIVLASGGCSGSGDDKGADTGGPADSTGGDPADADTDADADADADADTDSDADSDADTDDTGAGAAYADCVGTRTDSFGAVASYTYDHDGRLAEYATDVDADGTNDESGRYTWTVVGGVANRVDWTTDSGSYGQMTFDAHEHADASTVFTPPSTTSHVTYTNTHDATDPTRLTRQFITTDVSAATVTYDYDACELWTRQVLDVLGDGTVLYESTATWTVAAGCVPSMSVVESATSRTTTTYDTDGKTLTELQESSGGGWTATWTWSCP